jgi:hypothetical protein
LSDIVQYLAANCADFGVRGGFGRTPLEEAEFESPNPTIALVRNWPPTHGAAVTRPFLAL